jgi:manganese transport protein
MPNPPPDAAPRRSLWRSIGPALITACVVFGPGSLIISSNVGATYRYELLWLLLVTGLLMGTYLTMAARIGVCGGASPCTLLAQRLGRPAAFVVGATLCLVCSAFQFSNNLAVAMAAGAFLPPVVVPWVLVGLNLAVIVFLFTAREVYRALERLMKIMVAVVLLSFAFNLVVARPDVFQVLFGFVPSLPEGLELSIPRRMDDPMILIASLLGTTFSVAGAFFQGNLVREKEWTVADYDRGIVDSLAGVAVLTGVSLVIMITAATVIPGKPAANIGQLATTLQPLLGPTAFTVFCVGLFAVAMNPFLINAMIGGTILADGSGLPARMSDRWPRVLTVLVMLLGMGVAMAALWTGREQVELLIFGQAMTVIGNPLLAAALLWLANRKDVMGARRNRWWVNVLGGVGFVVVLLLALRMVWVIAFRLGWLA